MKIYDTANKLAQERKKSQEYLQYKEMKEVVSNNEYLKSQVDEFEKNRYLTQISKMQGEDLKEKNIQLEEMYKELIQNEQIKDYFEKEVKFNMLLADVNKIIAESVKDVL